MLFVPSINDNSLWNMNSDKLKCSLSNTEEKETSPSSIAVPVYAELNEEIQNAPRQISEPDLLYSNTFHKIKNNTVLRFYFISLLVIFVYILHRIRQKCFTMMI